MRRLCMLALLSALLAVFCFSAYADEAEAENISHSTVLSGSNREEYWLLTDGLESETVYVDDEITLSNEAGIGSIYLSLEFPCTFTVTDTETGICFTEQDKGFLHVFSDMEHQFGNTPKCISLQFPGGAWIGEIQTFSSGEVPAYVQKWEQPMAGETDIILFSTHGDDEHLYFAGLLPYYAAERELNVQVVYMTDHSNLEESIRQHEMLNGLWAVGIRTYPVFGPFPDFKIMNREGTYAEYENLGYSRTDLLAFVVENLRRFRPLVAVGHDLNGEYGHGMHMVYADLLTQAVEITADPESFPESAEEFGTWDVPKTYLHLYPENEIVMDWDQPMESFGGMTAFEVTQTCGFPCHVSQQYPLYTNWLYGGGSITLASQITRWNPCYFGLYRTTVGEDSLKNDFMENLISYGELARQNEKREQLLRNTVQLARQQTAVEPQLLRPVEEVKEVKTPESRPFPVFAAVVSLVTMPAIVLILTNKKFLEKKEKNT